MKKILVLTGSNSDLADKEGKPTAFVSDLDAIAEELNKEKPEQQIDYGIQACSADRTPFLLPSVINDERYDGIIYHGSYALVLGAAIQEALSVLKSNSKIEDFRKEIAEFMRRGRNEEYFPGNFDVRLVQTHPSKYHLDDSGFNIDTRYIPTIGVPGKDTPSQGTTALTSIVENPSGCEPRPVVGSNRIDTALTAMHRILYGMEQGFDSVHIVYTTLTEESKKGAESIRERLEKFNFLKTQISPYTEKTTFPKK